MEFPYGRHHRHHRPEPEEENPNPYPPPAQNPFGYQPPPPPPPQQYYGDYPPPPPVQHVTHEVGPGGYGPPPPRPPIVQHVTHEVGPGGYGPPPPRPPIVQHVTHEVGPGEFENRPDHHHHQFHRLDFFHHAEHVSHESGPAVVTRQPTVRIYTKAEQRYSLSIRNGQVVLAPANPRDEYQHWIKDLRYSTMVKDEERFPSFALVNKVTGEAIKHSIGATHPVRLVKYNPDYLDESVLWTESKDLGDGFRCIRMVNNIRLNFDAFHGDEDHGGVHDGTILVLWEWLKGKNQRWKIVPY